MKYHTCVLHTCVLLYTWWNGWHVSCFHMWKFTHMKLHFCDQWHNRLDTTQPAWTTSHRELRRMWTTHMLRHVEHTCELHSHVRYYTDVNYTQVNYSGALVHATLHATFTHEWHVFLMYTGESTIWELSIEQEYCTVKEDEEPGLKWSYRLPSTSTICVWWNATPMSCFSANVVASNLGPWFGHIIVWTPRAFSAAIKKT